MSDRDSFRLHGSFNGVIQKDAENIIDGIWEEREKLKEIEIYKTFILRIRKGQVKFLGYIMMNVGLAYIDILMAILTEESRQYTI